jgi:hypothetical protein
MPCQPDSVQRYERIIICATCPYSGRRVSAAVETCGEYSLSNLILRICVDQFHNSCE